MHAPCVYTGTPERMDSWLAQTALPWAEAGHGPVGSSSIRSIGSRPFQRQAHGFQDGGSLLGALWLAWTTRLGAPPTPHPTQAPRVSQGGTCGECGWTLLGGSCDSPLSLCCSTSRGGGGWGVPPTPPRGLAQAGGGVELSQLVNHCQASHSQILVTNPRRGDSCSCWGWALGGGGALSLLRCHLVVAGGSFAAPVVSAGGGCSKQCAPSHPHLPGWERSLWLELAPLGHCCLLLPPPPPQPPPERRVSPSLLPRYSYSLPRGPRGPGPRGGVLPSRAFPEPAARSYGAPGVEFMGLHRENNAVVQIHFLPGQCQLVTLLDDNSLHLWSLKVKGGVSELQEEESFTLRGPPGAAPSATQITVVLPHSSRELLYLGTESGNVFVVQLPAFRALEDQTISSDAVLQRLPEEARQRRVFEMVEALQEHPRNPHRVLIGYSRGLVVVWDLRASCVLCHFLSSQQLENVCWQRDGHMIVTCHSDGSYCQWPVSGDAPQPEPLRSCVPYGPFPCKAINKIFWLTAKQGLPFTIFQGGMPRASYGDRHCISVVHDGQQTAFDFTSRIIDFTVLTEADPAAAFDDPYALVVLAEEELVVIDLQAAGWPPVQPPYLASLHCSAITCSHHVSNIPLKLWERIIAAGSQQHTHFSTMEWPIDGGTSLAPAPPQRDLLLTGHEDGTVRFWDASGVCLRLLYKLSTVRVFLTDTDPSDNLNAQGEDEWPPLRKVGSFDPYSDDPRLGIQKIFLCKYSGYLAVAGTAGQVLVLELNDEEAEHGVEQVEADLLQDQEGYRWKGHERLCARPGPVHFEPGFQPFVLVQCQPPAVVTSLALHSEWRLVAFGTSHGFGLFDHQQRRQVFVKCTLHPSDQLALEGPLSRVKSLKKSLRQSFRRIRRSRVSSRKRRPAGPPGEGPEGAARAERTGVQSMELAPVQRKIEARSAEDSFTGFVRTLYFADTYLRDSSRHCPSLWAGTNGGTVYAFALRVPPTERRMDEPVRAEQAKEIQLMHRAPVVGILVLDGHSVPLPEPLEVAHDLSKSPDMQGSHQLLVVSEEQFKVFTLPKVSAKLKLKLTALEGSRVRRVSVAHFSSCRAEDYGEHHLAVLTNLGDVQVVSLPLLKPQVRYSCIRREDVSGIASCVFTKYGQGFYLISPSEFERFSLSTKWLVEPRCLVDSAETKSHRHPRNGSGPERALGQARNSGSQSDGEERRPGPVMEHALLNDERVLKEIQSTLEGDRGSCGDWRSQRVAMGYSLSNGGAE